MDARRAKHVIQPELVRFLLIANLETRGTIQRRPSSQSDLTIRSSPIRSRAPQRRFEQSSRAAAMAAGTGWLSQTLAKEC
jgi:hypothetical protein